MALTKKHKNPFARRIQIVFAGLVIGSVVGVLSSTLNGLFVYAGTVTFLDIFVTLFLKNAYLDSLNPKYVKSLLKITLKELKTYTVLTVLKRLSCLVIITFAVAVSSNILLLNTLLMGYLAVSTIPLLFAKYFGVKLPTIVEYDPNSKYVGITRHNHDVGTNFWYLNIDKRP